METKKPNKIILFVRMLHIKTFWRGQFHCSPYVLK